MSERLERYLQEIDHYLAVKRGAKEILAEIRSHILEKAAEDFTDAGEESVAKAIASYGSAREVAAQYLEGAEIIAPVFRKHLFLYTGILFAVHCGVMALAIAFNESIIMFPFFIVPQMSAFMWIFYVPMAFIADFGLIAFILMLVTQRRLDLRLPWPRLFGHGRGGRGLGRPRKSSFVTWLVLLCAATFLVVRYQTLFFYSHDFEAPRSLLQPASSLFFSVLFLAMLACRVIALGARFIVNSAWVNLARDVVELMILWIVWNSPIPPVYRDVPGLDMEFVGAAFAFVITAIVAVRFIKSLVLVVREMTFAGAWETR